MYTANSYLQYHSGLFRCTLKGAFFMEKKKQYYCHYGTVLFDL